MSISGYMRVGTADTYSNTVQTLDGQQVTLAKLQNELSSGLAINTPSDNPAGAATGERALTRLGQVAANQTAVNSELDSMTNAESALGNVTSTLQSIQTLVVSAGDTAQTAADRQTIAEQISQLSAQVLTLANTTDSNGKPLFGGLGSASTPFTASNTADVYTYNGLPGQISASSDTIPATLNGAAAFMNQPSTDGVYNVEVSNATTGDIPSPRTLTTSPVTLTNSTLVNGSAYTINVTGVDSTTVPGTTTVTYDVTENPNVGGPYNNITASFPTSSSGGSFTVSAMPGLSMTVTGTPAVGDTMTVTPSDSVFSTLEIAANDIGSAANQNAATQAVGQALNNISIALAKVSAVRGEAGTMMQNAQTITTNNGNLTIQEQTDQSNAENVNMVQTISEFQSQQTAYQAALASYAQIQKLSLFNYISS